MGSSGFDIRQESLVVSNRSRGNVLRPSVVGDIDGESRHVATELRNIGQDDGSITLSNWK